MADVESQTGQRKGFLPRTTKIIEAAFSGISIDRPIVIISLLQVAVYVLSCAMSFGVEPAKPVLYQLGATHGPDLSRFQIWRLIMPVFLHSCMFHLLVNILLILHIGLDKEAKYGKAKFLLLYFSSAIMGNMLTILMSPCSLAVGASTAGFGLVGSIITEICLGWNELDEHARRMHALGLTVSGALMFLFSYGEGVDVWGHLGGFICGVSVTCELNKGNMNLSRWFLLAMFASRIVCVSIVILTILRVFFGLPVPMGCL